MLHVVIGTTPSEWTNQEENHDDVAPLAEVQQKLKLRHARTVRLRTYICHYDSVQFRSPLYSSLFCHVLSYPFLISFTSYSSYIFFSIFVYLFSPLLITTLSLQLLFIIGTFFRWEVESSQNKKCDKCFNYDAHEYITRFHNIRVPKKRKTQISSQGKFIEICFYSNMMKITH